MHRPIFLRVLRSRGAAQLPSVVTSIARRSTLAGAAATNGFAPRRAQHVLPAITRSFMTSLPRPEEDSNKDDKPEQRTFHPFNQFFYILRKSGVRSDKDIQMKASKEGYYQGPTGSDIITLDVLRGILDGLTTAAKDSGRTEIMQGTPKREEYLDLAVAKAVNTVLEGKMADLWNECSENADEKKKLLGDIMRFLISRDYMFREHRLSRVIQELEAAPNSAK